MNEPMVFETVTTGFSPRFNAAIASLAAASAFSESSICEIRLCIRLVKFVDCAPAAPVAPDSDTARASALASFFAALTASAFKSSNSLTFSIIEEIASAALRSIGTTGVRYSTPAKERSRRMYCPDSASMVATTCCKGTPPAWIAAGSFAALPPTACDISVLKYKSITSGRFAYVALE